MIVAPETSRTQLDPVESSGPNQAQGSFWEKQKQDLKDGQIGRFENEKKKTKPFEAGIL